jgi:hypothetical protein
MHFLLGELKVDGKPGRRAEEGEKGIVQLGLEFMTRSGELPVGGRIRLLQIGE